MSQPAQQQDVPGLQSEMTPVPDCGEDSYVGSGRLEGKAAIITGGDSGIGRAVAIAFAKEGADVLIGYLDEQEDADARHTAGLVEAAGRRCITFAGDLSEEKNCQAIVEQAVAELGGLDIVVNNVAYQKPVESLDELSTEQWDRTFRTNIYSFFWVTKAALAHLPDG